jgi:hypothetical protein
MKRNWVTSLCALTLTLASSLPTSAETDVPQVPEFGVFDHEEARAASQLRIDQTENADGVWGKSEEGLLQHVQSGAVCQPLGSITRFVSLFIGPGVPGDDVGCHWVLPIGNTKISLFVTRNRNESARALLTTTNAIIGARIQAAPDGAPLTVHETKEGVPVALSTRLRFTNDENQEMRTSTWLNVVNGWTLKVRTTYPVGEDASFLAEGLSADYWEKAAIEIHKAASN